MNIKYYLYNTFVIKSSDKKIVIDPGAELYRFRFNSILPKYEWDSITHIFITHGDPDHYWYTDKVANMSGAKVICNRTLVKNINGKKVMLGPRSKGLTFKTKLNKVYTVCYNETKEIDGIKITGMHSEHGPIIFKMGPFTKKFKVGPNERAGFGAIGYKIKINNKCLINLGDTLLLDKKWEQEERPDVLMIPIGGKIPKNTMDEQEALRAVEIINPKMVIPCHYNCPDIFKKSYNQADDKWFKTEVEKRGINCVLLSKGEIVQI
ncbi:MBL fold metallo-hydrolase [Clostridiaceae bacterium M8S5]|nr:MBL fold metallo-hydrolase [Clostridiaceae bacterium M8S5]